MPLQLTGRHMTISDVHRDYIDKKVDRLRRLCPKIDELTFTLTKEKLHFIADGTFRSGSLTAVGNVTASQPLEAIDMLVDKMEHTISRQKAKRNDHHLTSREKSIAKHEAIAETSGVEPDDSPDEGEPARVTA